MKPFRSIREKIRELVSGGAETARQHERALSLIPGGQERRQRRISGPYDGNWHSTVGQRQLDARAGNEPPDTAA